MGNNMKGPYATTAVGRRYKSSPSVKEAEDVSIA